MLRWSSGVAFCFRTAGFPESDRWLCAPDSASWRRCTLSPRPTTSPTATATSGPEPHGLAGFSRAIDYGLLVLATFKFTGASLRISAWT